MIRGASIQLIALLESGDLDYAFEYESVIRQHGLQMVQLPGALNLGEEAYQDNYRRVQVNLDFQRFATVKPVFRGERIAYGITIPSNAPHPDEAALFIAFLLGPEGRALMQANSQPMFDPAMAENHELLPPALQALTRTLRNALRGKFTLFNLVFRRSRCAAGAVRRAAAGCHGAGLAALTLLADAARPRGAQVHRSDLPGGRRLPPALALLTGVPLAYLLARRRFRRKAARWRELINLPVVIPHTAAGIALLMVFGRYGIVREAVWPRSASPSPTAWQASWWPCSSSACPSWST